MSEERVSNKLGLGYTSELVYCRVFVALNDTIFNKLQTEFTVNFL